jgi:hypothetical protein
MTARLRQSLATSLLLLLGTPFASLVTAGQPRQPSDAETAAGCASCGACGGLMIVLPVAFFALNIALLVWVARDAKARSMDSAVIWMILVMFTGPIGLVIYLFSRPQGNLIQCPHCRNKRMEASSKCPHCGNA